MMLTLCSLVCSALFMSCSFLQEMERMETESLSTQMSVVALQMKALDFLY